MDAVWSSFKSMHNGGKYREVVMFFCGHNASDADLFSKIKIACVSQPLNLKLEYSTNYYNAFKSYLPIHFLDLN